MFRVLTSLPPGLVRFHIVDPIGIGRNFGAFMHLADFDEALVGGQVLTDPRQVEERLLELSAHMEKVTQKYRRNEYATIDEYNAVAGEVASDPIASWSSPTSRPASTNDPPPACSASSPAGCRAAC